MRLNLRRLRAHSPAEWRLFAQAWLLLPAIDLGLRLLPFATVRRLLHTEGRAAALASNEVDTLIRKTAYLVTRAAQRHLYPMTCLRRSLVLQRLLAARGIRTELRFGVRASGGSLQAHAWLEHDGRPVSEPEALIGRFAALASTQPAKPPIE